MKRSKIILLMIDLVLVVVLLTSCATLPLQQLGAMVQQLSADTGSSSPNGEPTADGTATPMVMVTPPRNDTVTISREEYEQYRKFDKLLEIMAKVDAYYYQDVDENDLLEGAAAGMLAGVDDYYTFYYTPEAFQKLWEDDEGEYAGIGILITSSYVTGISTVSRVFAGSPAEKVGVHKGDILYMVEDMYVSASNINDAVDIMRGTPGTTVNVTFLRNGEELPLVIERAQITTNRLDSGMLADGVGYIILYEFAGEDCAEQFGKAVDDLEAQGAKGLIIDLRDNPGGWVDAAQGIADLFVDRGNLCYLEYKDGQRYYYRTKDGHKDFELVILMNENSASSSEILAGCLKDRTSATIVGKQSYGKGIVQSIDTLSSDGSGMQVTIAQYFTPNGNAVHKIGITPDVEVDLDEGDNGMHEFGDLSDAQLKKALEIMQQKLGEQ